MSSVQIPDMLSTSNKKEKVNSFKHYKLLTLAMLSFVPLVQKSILVKMYYTVMNLLWGVYRWLDGN